MFFESSLGKIYYTKVGTGPHLCFLHGFCETSDMWTSQIQEFSKEYTCLTIDIPGFGKSENKGFSSISELATAIAQLLVSLDYSNCILFGHSMGGYIAAALLQEHEDLFSGIGFIHSTVYADSKEKKQSRTKVISFVKKHGAHEFLNQFYPNLVAQENLENLQEALWQLVEHTSADSIIQATKAMRERPDRSMVISSTQIPILFLCGGKDQHFPLTEIYKQLAMCSSAQISVLPDSGHLSILEEPRKASAAICEFLKFVKRINA